MFRVFLSALTLLSLTGCFLIGASDSAFGSVSLILPNETSGAHDYADYSETAYACVGDPVEVRYWLGGTDRATLSASPADALSPALSATEVSNEATLAGFEVVGAATLTLEYAGGTDEARLELIPADICTGLPADLLSLFTGTLMQNSPTSETLTRQLTFYWREAGLSAILSGSGPYELRLGCTADSETNSVRCSGVDTDFSLSATLSADGLTGSYQGRSQSSVATGAFSGTLNFKTP